MRFVFTAELVEWSARRNWFLVEVPEAESAEIAAVPLPPHGFDSVRVRAQVGATSWRTSIFPGGGRYALVVKRSVRLAERIELGDPVTVELELIDV